MSEESDANSAESCSSRGLSRIRIEGGRQSKCGSGNGEIVLSACYSQMTAGGVAESVWQLQYPDFSG
jgi:hypothetical protein